MATITHLVFIINYIHHDMKVIIVFYTISLLSCVAMFHEGYGIKPYRKKMISLNGFKTDGCYYYIYPKSKTVSIMFYYESGLAITTEIVIADSSDFDDCDSNDVLNAVKTLISEYKNKQSENINDLSYCGGYKIEGSSITQNIISYYSGSSATVSKYFGVFSDLGIQFDSIAGDRNTVGGEDYIKGKPFYEFVESDLKKDVLIESIRWKNKRWFWAD